MRNKIDGEKTLGVRIKLKNDYIIYTITDSGVGREKAAQLKQVNRPEHVSYGIQISKERLMQFNFPNLTSIQTGDTAGLIKFTDLYDNGKACGTKVEIHLKIDPTIN